MNCYDLLLEMLEAKAINVDHTMMRDGTALKMVKDGDVVYLDHWGGEMYVWGGYEGFNVLDTANGDPDVFDTWDNLVGEIDDDE